MCWRFVINEQIIEINFTIAVFTRQHKRIFKTKPSACIQYALHEKGSTLYCLLRMMKLRQDKI